MVLINQPIYCNDESYDYNCKEDSEVLKKSFEDLFYENKVDIVLQNSQGLYERTLPFYNENPVESQIDCESSHVNANAPVYIKLSGNQSKNFFISKTSFTKSSSEKGFGKLTVNSTHLLWEHFNSEKVSIIDYFYLVKS